MSSITMSKDRTITLPLEVCEKLGFNADTPIRIIETGSGVLLVPLTKAPMSNELACELADWQALSSSGWEMFPYMEAQL
jgi:bifunctional DNA-binding transcriptional regulator/antitoxin component of YhaV-PrlF toxin-antitoxin module